MNLWCKLLGHQWEWREINPHKEKYYGVRGVCERCNTLGPVKRPSDFNEEVTTINFQ